MALPEDQLPVEDENDFFDYASDALMGIPRGVEGAIQGAYNLADYLAFDVLPDYDTRFLGTSKTMAGGAVEGITQFATGFVPLFGLAGRAGALAKAGTATKAVVAGAATDFTFFNGQEARLSNLIQQVPELQNPVTEFLAYDGDEGELEGRMKNVLEGLGLEAVAGVFIKSLKAIKNGRKAKGEGKDAFEQADTVYQTFAPEKDFPLPPTNLPSLEPEPFGRALSQDADLDRVGGVWESMSGTESLFRTPTAPSNEVSDILSDLNVKGWEVSRSTSDAAADRKVIEISKSDKPSDHIVIFEEANTIEVDAQSAGRGGEGVYQTILQYAHNKGKTYIPSSLTTINQVRVIGAMFSSALKNKSTRHFKVVPDKYQTNRISGYFMLPEGYKWGENFPQDLKYLALAERNIVYDRMGRMEGARKLPEADIQRGFTFNRLSRVLRDGGTFRDVRERINNISSDTYSQSEKEDLIQELFRERASAKKGVDPDQHLRNYLDQEASKLGLRGEGEKVKPLDLDDYEYDFEEDKFYKLDEEGAREVLDESGIRQILKESDPDFTAGVGETTFKRAVVTNTTLSYDPDQIGRRLGERVQLLEGGRSSLERVFPSPKVKALDEQLGQLSPQLKKDFYDKTLVEEVSKRMQTGKPMTVREALQDLNDRTNGNLGQYSPIVEKLLALGKDTGIDAKIEERAFASNLPKDLKSGSYYESGTKRVVLDGRSATLQNNPAYVLLHEGTHAVTVDNVIKYFDPNSFNKISIDDVAGRASAIDKVLKQKDLPKPIAEMFRIFKKADSMRDEIVQKGGLITVEGKPDLYWIKNPAEFMSMAFSDPQIQQALKGIEYTPKMTLWEKIVNTVKSFFGKGVSTDMADNIVSRVGEIAEMSLPTTRGRRGVDFAPERPPIPDLGKGKEGFLNAVPEKFRGYADELLKGGTPRLPQFALETGEDVIVLKDLLESYYKENPDKITVEGAVTEVGEEIERQLMLQQGKDAATKVAEARVVQQSLRDQGSAVIDNLNQSLKKFDETDGGGVSIAEIKNNFQQLLSIADVYIKLGKEGGAFLGARREKYRTRKIGLSESDFFIDGIRKEFVNASGMDPKKMVSIIKENIDPLDPDATFDKLFKISKKAQGKHFLDMPTEYWMNAILSGPKTQVVNAMGNSLTQIWSSIEAVMGGIASGNMDVVRAVMASWADKEMFKEAGKFAKKAFKQSDNILDPEARAFSDRPSVAITGQRISEALPGQGLSVKQEQGLDWFANNVLRIPSRLLMTTDEFFKQLAYRRAARLKAAMSGIQQGVNDPKRLAEYINKTLEGVITEGGRMASKEGLAREANEIAASKGIKDSIEKNKFIIDYVEKNFNEDKSALIQYAQDEARYLTFTKELEEGIGKTFQDFTNRHPGFRFILPFVRTPTNILTFAIERTPLVANPLMKQEFEILRKEISSADPIVKAQARGKVVSAGLLTLGLVEAVTDADGSITGGGPKNEREKKALQAAGWQPYSIKIGDTYYSYQRLDPLATPLGIIADLVETGRDISALESKDSEKLIEHAYQSFIISLTRNITNKSYLTGVQNFVDALSDPDRFASKFNKNFASSFVPNILSQMADSDEQVMKETRGVMDAVKRKLGARGGLDSKRNALGEEIMTETLLASPIQALNPIAISTKKDDPVLQAMAELKHGFRNPIPNLGGDIDLLDYETESGQSAYDRWLQLSSEIRVKGDTLRQRLNRLVKSREFKGVSPLSEPGLPSPRIQMISSILDEYRKAARTEMLKEFPELDRKYSSLTLARTRLKTGVSREDVLALLTQ